MYLSKGGQFLLLQLHSNRRNAGTALEGYTKVHLTCIMAIVVARNKSKGVLV